MGWKSFFTEPELQKLITRALTNNRDLRTTARNIEKACGMYQIQRAELAPSIGITDTSENAGTRLSLKNM